jgi:hypothetical protein
LLKHFIHPFTLIIKASAILGDKKIMQMLLHTCEQERKLRRRESRKGGGGEGG